MKITIWQKLKYSFLRLTAYGTKEQRKQIYIIMLNNYKNRYYKSGLCHELFSLYTALGLINFPEVYMFKPNNVGCYWFPKQTIEGQQARIDILETAIKLCEK